MIILAFISESFCKLSRQLRVASVIISLIINTGRITQRGPIAKQTNKRHKNASPEPSTVAFLSYTTYIAYSSLLWLYYFVSHANSGRFCLVFTVSFNDHYY